MSNGFGFQGGGSGSTPVPIVRSNYGSFFDTTDQNATLPNTAYPMKFNSTDNTLTYGFAIGIDLLGNPTRIVASSLYSGIYNLQFSAQVFRSSGGSKQTIDLWLRVNDIDIPNTNTRVNVQANADYLVLAWNFFLKLNPNQYAQIMWATTSTDISIQFDPASPPHPETPSIIATIEQVNR
jgi:hypothetical protein